MKKSVRTIQVFEADIQKIRELAKLLEDKMGSFVSQRMAIMIAINQLLKDNTKKK